MHIYNAPLVILILAICAILWVWSRSEEDRDPIIRPKSKPRIVRENNPYDWENDGI